MPPREALAEDVTVDDISPIIWLTLIGTSLWVLYDASRLGVTRGSLNNKFLDEGPVGWFLCSLILWIIAFPAYLILRPRYVALRAAKGTAIPGAVTGPPYPHAPTDPAPSDDIPTQIAALASLHASGALSDTEFTAKKAELLDRM